MEPEERRVVSGELASLQFVYLAIVVYQTQLVIKLAISIGAVARQWHIFFDLSHVAFGWLIQAKRRSSFRTLLVEDVQIHNELAVDLHLVSMDSDHDTVAAGYVLLVPVRCPNCTCSTD